MPPSSCRPARGSATRRCWSRDCSWTARRRKASAPSSPSAHRTLPEKSRRDQGDDAHTPGLGNSSAAGGTVMASNGALDARDRAALLGRLAGERFDVLVIGGGITGAGAALDAASRGLRVALVEARDLASGTSSRSSKLIHGGLRYLEQFDFKLVYEALRERDLLVSKLAPHLVKPVSFLYPLYKKVVERPYVGAGLVLYDSMEGTRRPVPRHRHLSARGGAVAGPAGRRHALLRRAGRRRAAHADRGPHRGGAQRGDRHPAFRGRAAAFGGRGAGHRRPGARRGNGAGLRGVGRGRGDLRRGVDRPGARTGGRPGRLPGPDVQGRAHRGAAGGGGRGHRDDPAH